MNIPVGKCQDCPFFYRSIIAVVSRYLNTMPGEEPPPPNGDCRCPTQLPGSTKIDRTSLPVEDGRTLPTWCPLRIGDVVVTVGS